SRRTESPFHHDIRKDHIPMRATRGGLTAALLVTALALAAAGCGDSEPDSARTENGGAANADAGNDAGRSGGRDAGGGDEPAETGPSTVADSRGEQTLARGPGVGAVAPAWPYVEDLAGLGAAPVAASGAVGLAT